MLSILMWIGVFVLFFGILMATVNDHTSDSLFDTTLIMLGVMAVGGSLIGRSVMGTDAETEVVVLEQIPLAALGSNTQLEGTVTTGFLSSRVNIEDKRVYDYLRKNENGSYSMGTIDADGVEVFQDVDADDANITYKRCEYVDDTINFWLSNCGPETVEVHVPKGSIVQGFKIAVNE